MVATLQASLDDVGKGGQQKQHSRPQEHAVHVHDRLVAGSALQYNDIFTQQSFPMRRMRSSWNMIVRMVMYRPRSLW
jgi:hypothetical protein